MKTIIRTEILSQDLENFLNNLIQLYDIVHISHSTYVIDIQTFHSVVALGYERKQVDNSHKLLAWRDCRLNGTTFLSFDDWVKEKG